MHGARGLIEPLPESAAIDIPISASSGRSSAQAARMPAAKLAIPARRRSTMRRERPAALA